MFRCFCAAIAAITLGAGVAQGANGKQPSDSDRSGTQLTGVVTDSTGAPIAGARLEIVTGSNEAEAKVIRTSPTGEFIADSLTPGTVYSVLVTRFGYRGVLVDSVTITRDTNRRLHITLRSREVTVYPVHPQIEPAGQPVASSKVSSR